MTTKTKRGAFIEWIDVTERKPQIADGRDAIVIVSVGEHEHHWTTEARYCRELHSNAPGFFHYGIGALRNVTHWAELPPPFPESQLVEESPPQPDPEPAELNWVSSTDDDGNTVWEALSSFKAAGETAFYWQIRQVIRGDRIEWRAEHDAAVQAKSWSTIEQAKQATENYDRECSADYAEVETATVVVPVKPTPEMMRAGQLKLSVSSIWQAMLDAAPKT